jgi:hypothetical protein
MMGLPDDSFELLQTLVDEPENASFESALNNEDISYSALLYYNVFLSLHFCCAFMPLYG